MVVNLQMTKKHLTHKHWSHIVPGKGEGMETRGERWKGEESDGK